MEIQKEVSCPFSWTFAILDPVRVKSDGKPSCMRIGYFVWEYPPSLVGGLGTYSEYITVEYIRTGNDVSVYTLNRGETEHEVRNGVDVYRPKLLDATPVFFPSMLSDELKKWGDGLKFYANIFSYNLAVSNLFVQQHVRKEGVKFDIVAGHDWLSAPAAMLAKKELGLPFVFHVHSTEWGRSGEHASKTVMEIEEIAKDQADRVITVSNAMKEDLVKHGWPANKISVVWNGVDPDLYDPTRYPKEEAEAIRKKYGIKDDEKMLLFVGRLTWVKGIKNLVLAMPSVVKEHPEAKLVILGIGEQQKELQETVQKLGLEKNVTFRFDFVGERERILHYAASDLCIFPSVYEPFGIVSLEAMAMEKPVVVGAVGVVGFKEQVINKGKDKCGTHVNGNSPESIAKGINEILKDPEKMKKMGKMGRKRVLKEFTWRVVSQKTLSIYQDVIEKAQPKTEGVPPPTA